MRFKLRGYKFTIFPKLVMAFLLVVAPLYGVGLLMNKLGETSVRDEVANSLQSRINFYLKSLETEKKHTLNMLDRLAVDKDLHHLTFVGGFMKINDWSGAVLRLENRLQWVRESSIYIKNVSAHILTLNRTISSNKAITEQLLDDYKAVESIYDKPPRSYIYWQDRLFLGLPFPGSGSEHATQPDFVLEVEIDLDALRDSFNEITDYEKSGAILLSLQQQWEAANKKDEPHLPVFKQYLSQQFEKQVWEGNGSIEMGGDHYLVAYKYSEQLDSYLIVYVPKNRLFGAIVMYKKLLWLLSLLSVIVIFLYSYWIYQLIRKPLKILVRSFGKVENGQLRLVELPRRHDEFRYLFQHYNMMVDQLRVLIYEVYEQTLRVQTAELKQLQSQINPHFLYNTYFILSQLASINDNENVQRFSQHLGEYFQYITRSAANEVPLQSEVDHSRTYVEIQNIRFLHRIHVDFAELPERLGDLLVPKLLLQPVIENAYKHGLETKRKGGQIIIAFEDQESTLVISIEDNGDELSDEQLQKLGVNLKYQGLEVEYSGLLNVHRRLQLMFGKGGGLSVSRSKLGGLRVDLHIPLLIILPDQGGL
jgi:two-component system sensor histidine kinase YesM